MPSEKPTRHKKSKDEPVTIDLAAEPADAESTDASTTETAEAGTFTVEPSSEPVEDASVAASSDDTAKTDAEDAKPAAAAQPTPKKAGSSGAIAAGIFGGLVALAGAGAAQYAGYIPNFGPQKEIEITDYGPDIAALKDEIAAIAAKEPPKVDLTPVEQRLETLEAKVANLPLADLMDVKAMQGALDEATSKVAKAEAEIAAIANRLKQAEGKISEPRDDVEVARAIASAGLKSAIDRGGPFEAELATLETIAPGDAAIAELKTFAAAGVPSRTSLVKSFPDIANTILRTIHQPDENASLSERLLSSAMSVIKVRPVGNVEGDSPEAVLARIETRLQNNDLKGAAAEWQALPEAAISVASDFKASLDARIKVEELVDTALNSAVTGNAN